MLVYRQIIVAGDEYVESSPYQVLDWTFVTCFAGKIVIEKATSVRNADVGTEWQDMKSKFG